MLVHKVILSLEWEKNGRSLNAHLGETHLAKAAAKLRLFISLLQTFSQKNDVRETRYSGQKTKSKKHFLVFLESRFQGVSENSYI